MQDFRNLQVWHKAHALTLKIYRVTEDFPETEKYCLTNQMRRSSASIPTNIAEGCGRGSDNELARFTQIVMGSATELEYQLLLVHDLGLIDEAIHRTLNQDVVEVKRMLSGLLKTLKKRSN